jgi:hypothetical protein
MYPSTARQQDRQCTNNVTLRRVRELLLLWKVISISYWSVCACVHVGTRARGRVHARYVHVAFLTSMQRVCVIL